MLSGLFRYAKKQGCYDGVNPVVDSSVSDRAPKQRRTYTYSAEEASSMLSLFPEPAACIFAVAACAGLRSGEIAGLQWQDYHDGALHVTRSIVLGKIGEPKTASSMAAVPVIRPLAERLAMHRLRDGNPESGPIFRNSLGRPIALRTILLNQIMPLLDRCTICSQPRKYLNHVTSRSTTTSTTTIHLPWSGEVGTLLVAGWEPRSSSGRSDQNDPDGVASWRDVTTERCYVKLIETDVQAAMDKLDSTIETPMSHTPATKEIVN